MRIGINGRFLLAKQTGVQRAAYNMVATLVKVDRDNEYFLFTGPQELGKDEWKHPNVTVIPANIRRDKTLHNMIWEQVTLPRLARQHRVDILHSPANMAPLFYKGKSIVHIHDLCFVVNPQWYSYLFRTWYKFVIPRLARKATRVVTNSNNSRNDLLLFCKLPIERVSLVYWAVDNSFHQEIDLASALTRQRKDYILYVGSLEPRKNIRILVEAFELLRKKNPDLKTKLVLIGGESPLFASVSLTIKEYKDDIILKGFVNEHTLREYYRNAELVVYPSLYEGFGLPPLEAMASGTPVVTSITSSIPEVVGTAALTVDPSNVVDLSRAIGSVLRDQELRNKLIVKGFKQVRHFNWKHVARSILMTYHHVYSGRNISLEAWMDGNA
ncbi:MAG: glycosyltransferase family 4 protein [Deltaproteobacteria bacterium]|nr:glycosyltransferase family 4 protein [Deltaproteobacteria bacterium]